MGSRILRLIIFLLFLLLFIQSELLAFNKPEIKSFDDFDIRPLEETTLESSISASSPFVFNRSWGVQGICNSTGVRMGVGLVVKNSIDKLNDSTISFSKTIFTDLRSSFVDGKYYTSADEYTLLFDHRGWSDDQSCYALLGLGLGVGNVSNSLLTDHFVRISYRVGLGTNLSLFRADLDTNLCLNLDGVGYNLEDIDIFILPFEFEKFSPSISLISSYYF